MELKLTFDLLPVVSVLLVLFAYYLPGFNTWYGNLTQEWKQGFMLLALLLVSIGTVVLSVFGILQVYPAEWKAASMAAVVDFVIAMIVNAGVYKSADKINDKASSRLPW